MQIGWCWMKWFWGFLGGLFPGADPDHLRTMVFYDSLRLLRFLEPYGSQLSLLLDPPLSQPIGWRASQHYTWVRTKWSPSKIEHCPQKWEAICKNLLCESNPKRQLHPQKIAHLQAVFWQRPTRETGREGRSFVNHQGPQGEWSYILKGSSNTWRIFGPHLG